MSDKTLRGLQSSLPWTGRPMADWTPTHRHQTGEPVRLLVRGELRRMGFPVVVFDLADGRIQVDLAEAFDLPRRRYGPDGWTEQPEFVAIAGRRP